MTFWKKLAVAVIATSALGGCVHSNFAADKGRLIAPTLSKEAYNRVEPALKKLQVGQPMAATGLGWSVRQLTRQGRLVGLLAVADGWAGALSGDAVGALSTLGAPYALKDGKIYGSHLYGYLEGPALFVPRYEVDTVGTVISEDQDGSSGSANSAGFAMIYDDVLRAGKKVFFRDVTVERVKEVAMLPREVPVGAAGSMEELPTALFSKDKYGRAEGKIMGIRPGTDYLGVLQELDGIISAQYGGNSFILFMDGFLKYTGEHNITAVTASGLSTVWAFGYVEDGKEVPKIAMIFKNGVVERVAPYLSKEKIVAQLSQ